MTISDLQDELSEEIKEIVRDVVTTDATGAEVCGVTVYKQQLPIITSSEGDADDLFPYAVVQTYYGSTEDSDAPWTVSTEIQLGIYDRDVYNQGHRHIAAMCQRIIDRFAAEPLLAQRYWAMPDMEWAIPDADTYPYFFGFIRIRFSVPKIGRRMTEYD